MRIKIKFVLSFLILLFISLSLTSCLFVNERSKYDPTLGYFKSDNTDISLNENLYKEINNRRESIRNNLDTCNNFNEFVVLWNRLSRDFSSIEEKTIKSKINYHMEQSTSNKNTYEKLYSYYLDFHTWRLLLIKDIEASAYRNDFFKDYTEEEITKLINDINESVNKEADEISLNIEKNNTKFNSLSQEERKKEAPSILKDQMILNNSLANVKGFNSYFDYVNNLYGRDFSIDDIHTLTTNVKEYLVPLLYKYQALFTVEKLKQDESYKKFVYTLIDNFHKNKDYLDGYAEFLGDTYLKNFNMLFKTGHYFTSNLDNSYNIAYTTSFYDGSYYMYFGKDYQGIFTFVHEFGHYNAFLNNTSSSLDVYEIQSQGNEMLFLSYLMNNYDEGWVKTLYYYTIYDILTTIINASIITDFELYIYQNNILDSLLYDKIFKEIVSTYGEYDTLNKVIYIEDYWHYPTICSSGYYISYAVSAVAALSLFIDSNDVELVKNEYISLYKTKTDGIKSVCEELGLRSPFDSNSYIMIQSALNKNI